MPVDSYVSPGHVPDEFVVSDPGADGYNQPHVDLHNATSDMLDLVEEAVPAELDDIPDVDMATPVADGSQMLGIDGTSGDFGPMDAATPIAHGSTHAPDGTDPVDGLELVPICIEYDYVADAWPLRALFTDNTDRVAIWLCRVPGKDKPVGAGLSVPGKDIVLMADAP